MILYSKKVILIAARNGRLTATIANAWYFPPEREVRGFHYFYAPKIQAAYEVIVEEK